MTSISPPLRDPFGLVGEVLEGKYRVERVIGEGGFGVVYRGTHAGFDSPIAIKCLKLPPHFGRVDQEAMVRGLREEGRLLLRLSQRTSSIVQALDVGTATTPSGAHVPFLVLEWLDGRTLASDLRARIARGDPPRSLREAIALLEPAARALGVAHQERIAHRDIKPENLFLVGGGEDASIKVLDFGIAKVFADAPTPSGELTIGVSAFTPAYAAPEQFERKRGASGPWTDVYAFALVLVEIVLQKRALVGEDLAVLYAATSDAARRPTFASFGVDAPAEVDAVLAKAFAVDPAARFPDIRSFWEALRSAVPDAEGAPSGHRSRALAGADTVLAQADTVLAQADTVLAETSRDVMELDPAPRSEGPKRGEAKTEPEPPVKIPAAPRRGRSNRAPLALLAGIVALAAGGLVYRQVVSSAPSGPPRGAPVDVGSSSQPVPASSSTSESRPRKPEVEAAIREADRAWHDGDAPRAIGAMQRASTADPELGAPALRLALWQFEDATPKAREAYATANRLHASLDEKDAELLRAARSLFTQPWDLAAFASDLEKLVAKHPGDTELLLFLGYAQKNRLSFDEAVATFDRVIAVDPELTPARLYKAEALAMKGDGEGQLATYRDCIAKVPAAVGCEEQLVVALARAGRCDDMLVEAKRFASAHSDLASAHRHLADALEATGASNEAVLQAIDLELQRVPADQRKLEELDVRAALATLRGDFEKADGALEAWLREVDGKTDQLSHAVPMLRRARLHAETGDVDGAAAIADGFMKRSPAWTEPSGGDFAMSFLPFLLRGGKLPRTSFDAQRERWVARVRDKWKAAGRDLGNELEWINWSYAFGTPVETEEDARLAVSKLPAREPAALKTGRWVLMDYNLGRALALAGRPKDALAPLERASRSCIRLSEPTLSPRAALAYGMALEGAGDVAGARAAYRRVVDAWGHAKPASVSAKEAKRRLGALPGG